MRAWPCPTSTSTCRSLETISSGLCRFVAILDPPVTKIHGGPIQWGWISTPEDTRNAARDGRVTRQCTGNRDRRVAGRQRDPDRRGIGCFIYDSVAFGRAACPGRVGDECHLIGVPVTPVGTGRQDDESPRNQKRCGFGVSGRGEGRRFHESEHREYIDTSLLTRHDRVRKGSDAFQGDLGAIPRFHEDLRVAPHTDAGRGSGGHDIARLEPVPL